MNMNLKTKILYLFVIIMMASGLDLFSQPCPPGVGAWTNNTQNYDFGMLGKGGSVNYQIRTVGGEIQIVFDWNTLVNDMSLVISNDVLKKILTEEAVKKAVPCNSALENTISVVAVYYTSNCYATYTTWIKLDRTIETDCCEAGSDISAAEALMATHGGVTVFPFTNTVVCGTKCCAKIYSVKCSYDNISQNYLTIILSSIHTSITNCSGSTGYYYCNTNPPVPIPCEEGNCGN